ncbi:hypothetical protein D3C71_1978470 [compost metagenome]
MLHAGEAERVGQRFATGHDFGQQIFAKVMARLRQFLILFQQAKKIFGIKNINTHAG